MERLIKIVDFFYHKTLLPSALTVVTIYAAFVKESWAPYVLSPAAIIFTVTLLTKIMITAYDYGFIRFSWNVFKFCCKWLFGYFRSFTANKLVLFFIFLGIINFVGFTSYWIWYNINFAQIVSSLYNLIVRSVVFFSNPKEIMVAVVNLLDKWHVRTTLDAIHVGYVIPMIEDVVNGKIAAITGAAFISVVLLATGFCIKWLFRIAFSLCRGQIGNGSKKEVRDFLEYLSKRMEKPADANIVNDELISVPRPISDDLKDIFGEDPSVGSGKRPRMNPTMNRADILAAQFEETWRQGQAEKEYNLPTSNPNKSPSTSSSINSKYE